MTSTVPVVVGILGVVLFLNLYFVDVYPRYTIVGMFASTTMTASQTITNILFPIMCQDVSTLGCYYLTAGNLAVQVLSFAGVVAVVAKVLLTILTN